MCFAPVLRECVQCVSVMYGRRIFSSVLAITERMDMGMYEVPLFMSVVGFGMGTMLANFHMCGIILMLRPVLNILVRIYVYRCLMFNRS